MPAPTPQTAQRKMRSQSPPRLTNRWPVIQMQIAIAASSVRPYMWIVSGPMSTAPLDGDGIEARRLMVGTMGAGFQGSTVRHSPRAIGCLSPGRHPETIDARRLPGVRCAETSGGLEQDLESEIDRAATL